MCGIIGYLGKDTEAVSAVLTGLELLQNRGYDSAGISLLYNNIIKTLKYASTTTNNALSILKNELKTQPSTYIAIGHTRWATHGSKTDINAHPHNDSLHRISLVHNGIIENYSELKYELVAKGYVFTSSTDTEVISILIGSFLDEGKMITESIQKTIEKLKGTWAIVIIHKDYPNKMWAVRNGSPLLLGTNTECMMIASESIAFHTYITNYIILNDHDIIEIEYKNQQFIFNKNIQKYNQQIKK